MFTPICPQSTICFFIKMPFPHDPTPTVTFHLSNSSGTPGMQVPSGLGIAGCTPVAYVSPLSSVTTLPLCVILSSTTRLLDDEVLATHRPQS